MDQRLKHMVILSAEDDPDWRYLIRDAFIQSGYPADLRFVNSGETLLDYLYQRKEFSDTGAFPMPGLILLDHHLTAMTGLEALGEIQTLPALRSIPVIMLSISQDQDDIYAAYERGARGYVIKTGSFAGLLESIQGICDYWLQTVTLPLPKKDHYAP